MNRTLATELMTIKPHGFSELQRFRFIFFLLASGRRDRLSQRARKIHGTPVTNESELRNSYLEAPRKLNIPTFKAPGDQGFSSAHNSFDSAAGEQGRSEIKVHTISRSQLQPG